jgi:hypothetical protein
MDTTIRITENVKKDMDLLFPKGFSWNERIKVMIRSISPHMLRTLNKVRDKCEEENRDFDSVLRDYLIDMANKTEDDVDTMVMKIGGIKVLNKE